MNNRLEKETKTKELFLANFKNTKSELSNLNSVIGVELKTSCTTFSKQATQKEGHYSICQNSRLNTFHKFRDENPEKFLGPPILSTNVKLTSESSDVPDAASQPTGDAHSYGEMIKRYEFRKRDFRKEINPDMKFSMNSRLRKSQSQNDGPQKNKKTFINALQFFYNKINISDGRPNDSRSANRQPADAEMKKTTTKEMNEDESGADPGKKKEEAMNFIGDVAKNVLTKYDFFPRSNLEFLREGEGRHCSNPKIRDRELYTMLLH